MDSHDALLVVSFGGPEGPDEVMPFLERVTAGRGVPRARLEAVAEHYLARGGVSPHNDLCRDLIGRLEATLAGRGLAIPVFWGNRNAAPFLEDTLAEMAAAGIRRAGAFVTSAYGSYSGCRQYLDDIDRARHAVGVRLADAGGTEPNLELSPQQNPDASAAVAEVDKLRLFFNHPGFVDPLVDGLAAALATVADPDRVRVLFSAHSLPVAQAATCDYEAQIRETVRLVVERLDSPAPAWEMVWQSRSGPPTMPWLEPDVVDVIEGFDADEVDAVIVVPVGFVFDHMEVVQDLDTEAAAAAASRGFEFIRTATSAGDQRFVDMIVDLLVDLLVESDSASSAPGRPVALGPMGLVAGQCSPTCCPAPARRRPGSGR